MTVMEYVFWLIAFLALGALAFIGVKMWRGNRMGDGSMVIEDLAKWAGGAFVVGIAATMVNLFFFR